MSAWEKAIGQLELISAWWKHDPALKQASHEVMTHLWNFKVGIDSEIVTQRQLEKMAEQRIRKVVWDSAISSVMTVALNVERLAPGSTLSSSARRAGWIAAVRTMVEDIEKLKRGGGDEQGT